MVPNLGMVPNLALPPPQSKAPKVFLAHLMTDAISEAVREAIREAIAGGERPSKVCFWRTGAPPRARQESTFAHCAARARISASISVECFVKISTACFVRTSASAAPRSRAPVWALSTWSLAP